MRKLGEFQTFTHLLSMFCKHLNIISYIHYIRCAKSKKKKRNEKMLEKKKKSYSSTQSDQRAKKLRRFSFLFYLKKCDSQTFIIKKKFPTTDKNQNDN